MSQNITENSTILQKIKNYKITKYYKILQNITIYIKNYIKITKLLQLLGLWGCIVGLLSK